MTVTTMKSPTKTELERLRDAGKTREQIAEKYGVSLSRVKRWIRKYGLQRQGKPPPTDTYKIRSVDDRSVPDDWGLTVVERAIRALGTRVEVTAVGYKLDGRLVNTPTLLKEAGIEPKPIR